MLNKLERRRDLQGVSLNVVAGTWQPFMKVHLDNKTGSFVMEGACFRIFEELRALTNFTYTLCKFMWQFTM